MQPGERFNPYRLFVGAFIPNWLLTSGAVPPAAKLVYGRLAQFAGKKGVAFPRQDTLARECGLAERTVQRSISRLEELGLIEAVRGETSSRYYFLWPGDMIEDSGEPGWDGNDEPPPAPSSASPSEPEHAARATAVLLADQFCARVRWIHGRRKVCETMRRTLRHFAEGDISAAIASLSPGDGPIQLSEALHRKDTSADEYIADAMKELGEDAGDDQG